MPAGAPFTMTKARELVARLRFGAAQAADEEAARTRTRSLHAEEYAARHTIQAESAGRSLTRSEDTP